MTKKSKLNRSLNTNPRMSLRRSIASLCLAAVSFPFSSALMASSDDAPPPRERMMLWLDAADETTLFADRHCTLNLQDYVDPSHYPEGTVGCWKDKSFFRHHMRAESGFGRPELLEGSMNGGNAVQFNATELDYLVRSPANPLKRDGYVFTAVIERTATTHSEQPLFASGTDITDNEYEVIYEPGEDGYVWRDPEEIEIPLEVDAVEPVILTISRQAYSQFQDQLSVFENGVFVKSMLFDSADNELAAEFENDDLEAPLGLGTLTSQFRLNTNLEGTEFGDNLIAELRIYKDYYNTCRMQYVWDEMSDKFGIDVPEPEEAFDLWLGRFNDGYNLDLAAIHNLADRFCIDQGSSNEAVSAELALYTESEPSSGDYLVVGHNDEGLSVSAHDIPSELTNTLRLDRVWAISTNGILSSAGRDLTVQFDLIELASTFGIVGSLSDASLFVLLMDPDQDGDFSNAEVLATGDHYDNYIVTFDGINLAPGSAITLAFVGGDGTGGDGTGGDGTGGDGTGGDGTGGDGTGGDGTGGDGTGGDGTGGDGTGGDGTGGDGTGGDGTGGDGTGGDGTGGDGTGGDGADGCGMMFCNNEDHDLDGILSVDEPNDTDGDSVPDYLEPNNMDTDQDGVFNHQDPNDDGDAKPTIDEVGPDPYNPIDADVDNIPDYLDADDTNQANTLDGSGDTDGDRLTDLEESGTGFPWPDQDNDGLPDYADNDLDDGTAQLDDGDQSFVADNSGVIRTSLFQSDGGSTNGVFALFAMLILGLRMRAKSKI